MNRLRIAAGPCRRAVRVAGLPSAIACWLAFGSSSLAIDFEQKVEPIFRAHCVGCHGPDEQNSQFRVDRLSALLGGGESGEPAVVPGNASASFLLKLIRHREPGLEMPPDDSLSEDQIRVIEEWIDEGARTPPSYGPRDESPELTHWSFQSVVRPSSANSIDGFIGKQLKEHGLAFSSEADRRVLIRRLYLVVLGIPPSPEQVAAFVQDDRDDCWQRLVEQVLASPQYGERLASMWLDLVRFGETHGFEMNRERPTAWPYRDWVIASFNDDKPYDEFVRAQIAGDAISDEVGTGFLVAGPLDQVKGQDPKLQQMQRMNELDDMINTSGTAFLGLTTGCARCHNHKFDPISQKDYYAMQAVFAGVQPADGKLRLTGDQQRQIASINEEMMELERSLAKFLPVDHQGVGAVAVDDGFAEYLEEPRGKTAETGKSTTGLWGEGYTWWKNEPGRDVARYHPRVRGPYRIWLSWGAGFATHTTDARYLLETPSGKMEIARVNQQLLADGSGRANGEKRWSGFFDAGVHQLHPEDSIVLQGGNQGSAVTGDVIVFQEQFDEGDAVMPVQRSPVTATHNIDQFAPREARFIRFTIGSTNGGEPCLDELQVFSRGHNVGLASRGAKATSSGDFQHPKHKLEHLNDGRFGNSHSWISAQMRGGWVQIELPEVMSIDRIEWARDRNGEYADRLATSYCIECAVEPDAWEVIATSDNRLSAESVVAGEAKYVFADVPEREKQQGKAWLTRLTALQEQKARLEASTKAWIGTFSQPSATYRLYRGEPDARREQVGPNAIAAFTSLQLDADAPERERRIAFAEWIADRSNPLTARVIVNRLWQFHFGVGIVDTPSDFGSNGTPPSHPELLDWLAIELMDSGWSLKHIHRLILSSRTWRQDNRPIPAAIRVDSEARLLWRFMPRRLEAEGIRDSILAVSGVLDLENAGGPGFSAFDVQLENVRHYHPKEDFGPEDWRRMIYMTKVRQEKDQVFGAFDCPDASMVVPRRTRSTTPLQALNLLNSRFVIQQAEILAERLEKEGSSDIDQIRRAWQLCFQRDPTAGEIDESRQFIARHGLTQFARAMLNTNEFVFIP